MDQTIRRTTLPIEQHGHDRMDDMDLVSQAFRAWKPRPPRSRDHMQLILQAQLRRRAIRPEDMARPRPIVAKRS